MDVLAERIQTLGGVSTAISHDVAETSITPRLPRVGRRRQFNWLDGPMHTRSFLESRTMAKQAAETGDDGTNDVLVAT